MISNYYGKYYNLDYLRDLTYIGKEGVSLLGISDAAEHIGLHSLAVKISYDRLVDDIPLPLIAHWKQRHFVVVYKVTKSHAWVADPAGDGVVKMARAEFEAGWTSDVIDDESVGVLLLLETTPEFFEKEGHKEEKVGFSPIWVYLKNYKPLLWQLAIGLIVGTIIAAVFPFIIQAVVDIGINNQDLNFIGLLLAAHLVLFATQMAMEYIRGWILLHIGVRVNISLISDFLQKMIRLPIKFFESKLTGDLVQRMYDAERVETFLTSTGIQTLFSFAHFIIFGLILWYYDTLIFLVFIGATALYLAWLFFFMKRRRELDQKRFDQLSENQVNLLELFHGIKDIKLHNAEQQKRWVWERTQAQLYRLSTKFLAVEQKQLSGVRTINETKNILITFIAAREVITGGMTLGMLLAVQYIIGQLNSVLMQWVEFLQDVQDARLSLERMQEIHRLENEEIPEEKITIIPENGDLSLEDVSFRYGGPEEPYALQNVTLRVPEGKHTAIVGSSGSGKTTLIKLLLNFYDPTEGQVKLGDIPLNNFKSRMWRDRCGVVMQDSFIFSDSIAKNIAISDNIINKKRLIEAAKLANIQSFIESLPLGYNTLIGEEGMGLSRGQAQRILIARAVYKNPEYLFFDEATNALDAFNEMTIVDNLEAFFEKKTVITVAHRMSTVRNADKIIVLEKGEIIEEGTHNELIANRAAYYHLIKNQLELGV